MGFLLTFLFVLIPIFSAYGWVSYSLTQNPTGRTRFVKDGMEYKVEAECKWFFNIFRCWRKLSKWKSVPLPQIPYSNELEPKPYDNTSGFVRYKVVTFETKEEAEEAAIEWRTQNLLEEKKHEHDGPKGELTAPVQ